MVACGRWREEVLEPCWFLGVSARESRPVELLFVPRAGVAPRPSDVNLCPEDLLLLEEDIDERSSVLMNGSMTIYASNRLLP
jgi:hypothetical protein